MEYLASNVYLISSTLYLKQDFMENHKIFINNDFKINASVLNIKFN